jgi:hypothetical protein
MPDRVRRTRSWSKMPEMAEIPAVFRKSTDLLLLNQTDQLLRVDAISPSAQTSAL